MPSLRLAWSLLLTAFLLSCSTRTRNLETALEEEATPAPGPVRIGMNVSELADYSTQWAFVDVFKQSRPWMESEKGQIAYDEQGNPRLKPGQSVKTLMVREIHAHYPAGIYVATFQGKGEVTMDEFDVKKVKARPGRIESEVIPANNGVQLTIEKSDPKDPIRDIHVWMPGFEKKGATFHPLFLERLEPFEVLRFMDWQKINDSKLETWAQRAKPTDARYTTAAGVPVEIMVELANTRKIHPWFCIPHKANDDYVRSFARVVKEKLDPKLKVYVEYSNEVWNSAFDQSDWAEEQGKRLKLGDPAGGRFYAQRSVEIFKIWEDVFGGHERLMRVLASQFVVEWLSEQILTWNDAYKHADALAVAPYFGNIYGDPKTATEVSGLSVDQLLDKLDKELAGKNRDHIQNQAKLAKHFGLELIAYEGGAHLVGYGGAENNEKLAELFVAANRHPRMHDLYRKHLTNWFEAGGGLYVAYNYITEASKWGAWGALEYQDQPLDKAHKYRALVDCIGSKRK